MNYVDGYLYARIILNHTHIQRTKQAMLYTNLMRKTLYLGEKRAKSLHGSAIARPDISKFQRLIF